MWWVYILPVVGVITGISAGLKLVRNARRPYVEDEVLLWWNTKPMSAWHQDRSIALWEWTHTLGSLFLIMFMVVEVAHHIAYEPTSKLKLTEAVLVVVVTLLCSLQATERFFSFEIMYPVSLLDRGIARGQVLLYWKQFSHFQADATTHVIKLYSRRFPSVVLTSFQAPDTELLLQSTQIISHYLPSYQNQQLIAFANHKIIVIGYILLYSIFIIGIAILAQLTATTVSWPIVSTIIYLSALMISSLRLDIYRLLCIEEVKALSKIEAV